jgi:hypothetical protein
MISIVDKLKRSFIHISLQRDDKQHRLRCEPFQRLPKKTVETVSEFERVWSRTSLKRGVNEIVSAFKLTRFIILDF